MDHVEEMDYDEIEKSHEILLMKILKARSEGRLVNYSWGKQTSVNAFNVDSLVKHIIYLFGAREYDHSIMQVDYKNSNAIRLWIKLNLNDIKISDLEYIK